MRTDLSALLSEARQQEVITWFQQLDPLVLSAALEGLYQALWNCSRQASTTEANGAGWSTPESVVHHLPVVSSPSSAASPYSSACQVAIISSPPFFPSDEPGTGSPGSVPLEEAMASYLQELREGKRLPKTLEWHQTSFLDLQRFLWRAVANPQVSDLTPERLHAWLADLHTVPSVFTGHIRSVATIAAYARSMRAFCSWLVRKGFAPESPFPPGAVPQAPEHELKVVDTKAFTRLLEVCDCSTTSGLRDQGMIVHNRAILWLLRESGLQVSDLCGLRLADVDSENGVVMVREKGRGRRTFPRDAINAFVMSNSSWKRPGSS